MIPAWKPVTFPQPGPAWANYRIQRVEFIAPPRSPMVQTVRRLKALWQSFPTCALMERLPNGDYRLQFTLEELQRLIEAAYDTSHD